MPGKVGIILCFPGFFANQEKPEKDRIFIPGFPGFNWCFTGKLGVILHFPSFFTYRKKPGKRGHSGFFAHAEKPGKCGQSWLSVLSRISWFP